MARIYAMALELIRHTDGRLDRLQLVRFMAAYQTVAPLTIGELWAWPSMLKLALIENLRRLAEETLQAREARLLADRYLDPMPAPASWARRPCSPTRSRRRTSCTCSSGCASTDPVSPVRAAVEERLAAQGMTAEDGDPHRTPGPGHRAGVGRQRHHQPATLLDPRLVHYFESVSLVEQVLQRDPAAVYGQMDFLSRDRYRQAVEELAEPSGDAQLRVALRTVESARTPRNRQSPEDAPRTSATT